MAGEWVQRSLGELINIKHGFAFKGEFFRDEPPGDILLTPGNFAVGGGFKADKFKYYDGPVPDEFVMREGDLVVTMTDLSKNTDTLGYPAVIPSSNEGRRYLHNQRLGKVIAKDKVAVDFRYLHYLMCSEGYRHEVVAGATGTTVKHTSPDRIKRFHFWLPPLEEQRAIGYTLGTLDDKIELNGRLNETLESMARAIFKSWFVEFDPIRAKADGRDPGLPKHIADLFPDRFVDSELGEIPAGWKTAALSEAMEVNPRRSLKKGEVASYLDMKNMPTQSARAVHVYDREFGSGVRFVDNDTLVARITPCLENGKTCFVDFLGKGNIGWGSTEYIVLRPKPQLPAEFAYFLARTERFRTYAISSMTGTSGRQRVPAASLGQFMLAVPPTDVARVFGKMARTIMNTMKAKDEGSDTLAALREALLPRLISGELRVPEAGWLIDAAFRDPAAC